MPPTSQEWTVVMTAVVAAQVLGLVSAWLTRISQGCRCEAACQWLFCVCLSMVGLATMVAFAVGPYWWLATATVFAIMVLAATCDFRHSRRATTW